MMMKLMLGYEYSDANTQPTPARHQTNRFSLDGAAMRPKTMRTRDPAWSAARNPASSTAAHAPSRKTDTLRNIINTAQDHTELR